MYIALVILIILGIGYLYIKNSTKTKIAGFDNDKKISLINSDIKFVDKNKFIVNSRESDNSLVNGRTSKKSIYLNTTIRSEMEDNNHASFESIPHMSGISHKPLTAHTNFAYDLS